jgi:serine/threonine-protein kinase RsbW
VGCPMAYDAVIVGSELATNAITHSDSRKPGGQFIVLAEAYEGDYLWIEVEDQGGPWIERDPTDEHGRGLLVVAALSSDWGIEGDSLARVVWARFDWPGR